VCEWLGLPTWDLDRNRPVAPYLPETLVSEVVCALEVQDELMTAATGDAGATDIRGRTGPIKPMTMLEHIQELQRQQAAQQET